MAASRTVTSLESRKAQLIATAEKYFHGLTDKDMSQVPWHDSVILRSPLAPGFPDRPLTGRAAVLEWFATLYPVLGTADIIEHHWNESMTSIATRADVHIQQPRCLLRVIDRFVVDPDGLIVEQENHYDPRPALVTGRLTDLERDLAVELLENSRELFLACLRAVTPAQWSRNPGQGRWSIAECAEHVAVTEEALLAMVRDQILQQPPQPDKLPGVLGKDGVVIQAMRDRTQKLKTFDFLEPKGRWTSRQELERAFAGRRARTIEFVRATDAALHHHFAPLGPLGDLDAYQWILLVASHTERHVRQIEEILAG